VLRRAIEDQLDPHSWRDDRAEPADERGRRSGTGTATEGVEQVRAVHQEALDATERIAATGAGRGAERASE